jgi:hypothetical protein
MRLQLPFAGLTLRGRSLVFRVRIGLTHSRIGTLVTLTVSRVARPGAASARAQRVMPIVTHESGSGSPRHDRPSMVSW